MTKKAKPTVGTKGAGSKKEPDTAFRPFGALKAMRDEMKAHEEKGAPAAKAPHAPAKPTKSAATTKETEEDEALALYRMMNGVTPLAGKATRLPKSQAKLAPSDLNARKAAAEEPVRAEEEAVHEHLRALVEGGRFEVQDDGRRVEGRRHGITPEVARKLRRGNFPIDGRIDLHGETAASAKKTLEAFLKAQKARGERCVLVVHGKGEHSPRGVGILRGEMAAWLSQGSASVCVAAFATAGESDGGEGAVYVLLTR
jgi:DNA-nicking Smr family endonuclease